MAGQRLPRRLMPLITVSKPQKKVWITGLWSNDKPVGDVVTIGAISLNQLFSARPLPRRGIYCGVIPCSYICGFGTKSRVGGISRAPEHNAARVILVIDQCAL